MCKYIEYKIEALEDLKFSKTNIQVDSEETMEYITGAAIRGAFIYKYIMKHNLDDINACEHREKLLKGKIKFLNAYPEFDGKRSIPFPRCFLADKEKIKAFEKSSETILDIKVGLDDENFYSGYERVKKCEFVGVNGDTYTEIKINKKSNLHINKNKEKNNLFRYEAIEKGQIFIGIIKVEEESYLEEIHDLFENAIVYLGGSKGSGYGKCVIRNLKLLDYDYNIDNKVDNIKDLYLIAESDIIYRSNIGEYKTKIDEYLIKKELGISSVTHRASSIEIKNITSFNNKWNCRTPQIVGIKAGSVFRYEIDGKIDSEKLRKFIDKGIGERKIDGFGRFSIAFSLEDAKLAKNSIKNNDNNVNVDYKLNKDEENQLQYIIDKIYMIRINNEISNLVIGLDKKLANTNELNNSQWGYCKDLFKLLSTLDHSEGNKKYNESNKHIMYEKQSELYKKIRKIKYDGVCFIEFINKLVKCDEDEALINKTLDDNIINLQGLNTILGKDEEYKFKMKILSELCRYHIRKEKRNEQYKHN